MARRSEHGRPRDRHLRPLGRRPRRAERQPRSLRGVQGRPLTLDAVAFDLGNVLVGLDPSWSEPLGIAPADMAEWLDHSDDLRAFERGMLSRERFYAALATFAQASSEAAQDAFCSWVTGPLEGAPALLDRVVVPCFAASNTNVDHWARFDPERTLRSRFTSLASHHLGARKPEPAYFARATAIMGTAQVLFLDDRADNVAAARRAGWRAEQVVGVSDCLRVLQEQGLLR